MPPMRDLPDANAAAGPLPILQTGGADRRRTILTEWRFWRIVRASTLAQRTMGRD